jgi:membrane-associated phospholipid phosphatase
VEQEEEQDQAAAADGVSPATRRPRRPTGEAPPLPKSIGVTGALWLALVIVVVVSGSLWLHATTAPLDAFDAPITRLVTSLRAGWLDTLARGVDSLMSRGGLAVLGLVTVLATAFFRRWRHIILFLISLALLEVCSALLNIYAARPRPFDVAAIGTWEGYSAPSAPITGLACVLIGVAYMLVVHGRPRNYAKVTIAVVVFAAGLIRIYLGIDHFTDVIFGVILGVAIPVALFRAFVPNDVFPVRYGEPGKSAHLDVGGRRGEAIRQAMEEELGYSIQDMKPVGLEGSGGSTPLKMRVVDEHGETRTIFAKLYAKNHVRADHWYKLGRTMLYGRLEDETPFKTVRRFVEYEDYALRLLADHEFPTPAALGIVEITPEQEYLIAMEFFDDSLEIGEASVDEQIIDEGLDLILKMWDDGLAHRDIKPANLMVKDGHLKLIDVFFVQVRPSPWRQAVDLGNMMLVLALRSDAQTVYRRALTYFSPDELAEAFAATRGVASPTQLRQSMKEDGRDLLAEFRELAPKRQPITIQRWSVRRVLLIVATVLMVVGAGSLGVALFFPTRGTVLHPSCGTARTMQLMAQSVPSATRLPCVGRLPAGWGLASAHIVRDSASITLRIGGGVLNPVVVTLTATCPPAGDPTIEFLPVEGGCVTYQTSIPEGSSDTVPSFDPGGGLSFVERSDLVTIVEQKEDLTLCGADAPPCGS